MPYAIVLYFDPAAEARIAGLWRKLAQAAPAAAFDSGARPHLSLAAVEEAGSGILSTVLADFARDHPRFAIDFASAGCFLSERGIVFLAPVVTRRLIDLHARLHAMLRNAGVPSPGYYAPDAWIPHCTIAQEVTADRVGRAIELALAEGAVGRAICTEIALVKYRPVEELFRFALASDAI